MIGFGGAMPWRLRTDNDEFRAPLYDDSCSKCGADLDDGECEECERAAPLDFDERR